MDKELSFFCDILDRSHVLILLNIEKYLSGVVEVAPAVKILLMTVTQFPTNMPFSCDNDFNTFTTSSRLMGSHSRLLEFVEALKWVNRHHSHLNPFIAAMASCLPTPFKNNCSAWVNSLYAGWSNLSFMPLTIESRSSWYIRL